jgi:lysophospholipase L1-like esterase
VNEAAPRPAIDVAGDPAAISGAAESGADGASAIDSVVMIGDSITKGSLSYLQERFGLLGLDPTIEAEGGKRMAVSDRDNPSGAAVATFLSGYGDGDHSDEVWVVALGTNDISQYSGPEEIAAAVNEVLAEVPDEAALVWVDTYVGGREDDTEAVNSIIRERVEQRGDSVIAPWTAFVNGDGVLTSDGVHPTSGGADVFAFVVTDTVRAFLGR